MRLHLLLLLLALPACASTGGSGPDADRQRTRSDRITHEEIVNSGASSAYDLVASLRPQWLRGRGLRTLGEATGDETLKVYLDGAPLGPPDAMRQIPLGSVRSLRFLTAAEATQRWGSGHLRGAILISTRDP